MYKMYVLQHLTRCQTPRCVQALTCPCFAVCCSGSGEDSLDRLLPPSGAPRRKSATSLSKTEPPLLRTGTRTIYTAGRPPWYDEHGAQSKEAFVIGMSLADVDVFILLQNLSSCPALSYYTHINTALQSHMHNTRQH